MKILVVSSLPDRSIGGVEAVVRLLCRELRERGHDAVLVTNEEGARASADHLAIAMQEFRTRFGMPTPGTIVGAMRSMLRVWKVLRRERPDVVNVHFLDYALVYWCLARPFFRFRLVATGHGSEVTALAIQQQERASTLRLKLVRFALRRCDARTATSSQIAQEMSAIAGMPVRTVGNGIDLQFWAQPDGASRARCTIACVSRLSSQKGVDTLLDALALLRTDFPEIECVVAGEGAEHDRLERRAADLELIECVRFGGQLDGPALRDLLRRCTLFVLPSLAEGVPLVMLEAAACGAPMVLTRVGGIPDIVRDGHDCRLVTPGDPQALARAIAELVKNEPLRTRLAAAAAETAALHSAGRMAAGYLAAYDAT